MSNVSPFCNAMFSARCLRSSPAASGGSARYAVCMKHPVASVRVGSYGRALVCSREQSLPLADRPAWKVGAVNSVAVARVWRWLCGSLALRKRSAGLRFGAGTGFARAVAAGELRSPAVKRRGAPGLAAKASAALWANQSFKRTSHGVPWSAA